MEQAGGPSGIRALKGFSLCLAPRESKSLFCSFETTELEGDSLLVMRA